MLQREVTPLSEGASSKKDVCKVGREKTKVLRRESTLSSLYILVSLYSLFTLGSDWDI